MASIARPDIQLSCNCPHPAFVGPDGSLVLTGSAGANASADRWVVARLTPSGALDPKFGHGGVATLAGPGSGGDDVARRADGSIVALGSAPGAPSLASGRNLLLARLLPNGTQDPAFAGGAPLGIPANAGAGDVAPGPTGRPSSRASVRSCRSAPTGISRADR